MILETSIDFIKASVDKHKLLISSERPLEILSSAVLNGGFTTANNIISIHVPEENEENSDRDMDDLDKELHENPVIIIKRALTRLGIYSEKTVGMMTHADVRNVEVSCQRYDDISLCTFVTGGVEVAATAGELTISKPNASKIDRIGAINVILLVDGYLTESCMVDAIKTVIEAKTVALRELDVRSYFSGDLASGTVTDSIVIACTKRGTPINYAGTATVLGELIGHSVKESLKRTLFREQKVEATRCLIKRLEERKISINQAANLFLISNPELAEKSDQFKKELHQALSNPKIVPVIIAGLRLDDDLKANLIPKDMFDKSDLIKSFQTTITECLNNKKEYGSHKFEDSNFTTLEKVDPFVANILKTIPYSQNHT